MLPCLLFASVGQASARTIASLPCTLFPSLLTHRLVLLCIDAHCFIFWDLPGDVLAAPESALGLDRCYTSLSLSLCSLCFCYYYFFFFPLPICSLCLCFCSAPPRLLGSSTGRWTPDWVVEPRGWKTVEKRGEPRFYNGAHCETVGVENRRTVELYNRVEPWRMRFLAWITVCINLQPASTACQAAERPIAGGAAARPSLAPACTPWVPPGYLAKSWVSPTSTPCQNSPLGTPLGTPCVSPTKVPP